MASIKDRIQIIQKQQYRGANTADARLDAFTVAYYVAGYCSGAVSLTQLFDADARNGGRNPYTDSDKNRWYDGGQLVRQAKPIANGEAPRGHWHIHPQLDDATFTLSQDACELARSILEDLQRLGLRTVEELRQRPFDSPA